jgi:hypothetical protein
MSTPSRDVIICDIDGTVADLTHRLPLIERSGRKDWNAFFDACGEDTPHDDIIRLLVQSAAAGCPIVYVSGRTERCRRSTLEWLARHGCPPGPVFLRRNGDYRADDVVKEEILDRDIRLEPSQVWFVLDDRDRVVSMWRRRGFRVLQVAEGDF